MWQDPLSPHLKGLPSSPLPIILSAPWPQGSLSEADLDIPGGPCSLTPSMDTQMLAQSCSISSLERGPRTLSRFHVPWGVTGGGTQAPISQE